MIRETDLDPVPLIMGPDNIRYDFQDGCRVLLPPGRWEVEFYDLETHSTVKKVTSNEGLVTSTKKYFVPYRLRVFRDKELIVEHVMDLRHQTVMIEMHKGGIGDHLAWMGHVERFAKIHSCKIVCLVRTEMRELFKDQDPSITITDDPAIAKEAFYARYSVLIFFNDLNRDYQPLDFRQIGLVVCGAYVLGLQPIERRPSVHIAAGGRPYDEKYVCIATQASGYAKYWHNPFGWYCVIRFLKAHGYRVICIDRDRVYGSGTIWSRIPHGAEDMTGSQPLSERARYLAHADFFIGLTSGLSWLAWAVGTPVVMISGYTEPYNEFFTPFRVINRNVCTGCANDVTVPFERNRFRWCPRLHDTAREFECTREITVQHVEQTLERVMLNLAVEQKTHD